MAHYKKLPMIFLALLSIGLLSSQAYGLAVMSIDIGSEWMKIAIVSVIIPILFLSNFDKIQLEFGYKITLFFVLIIIYSQVYQWRLH